MNVETKYFYLSYLLKLGIELLVGIYYAYFSSVPDAFVITPMG